MNSILKDLNEKQIEAVTTTEGPVLIVAGPGSGKTKALTHRIAYLISEKKVPPEYILAVTFTNKAAGEMRERVTNLLHMHSKERVGEKKKAAPMPRAMQHMPTICTFHSLGAKILRREAKRLGVSRHFTIYDEDDTYAVIKDVIEKLHINKEQYTPKRIQHTISALKNELALEGFLEKNDAASPYERVVARVIAEYQRRLKESNAFDFDDLIMQTVTLLRNDGDVRERLQKQFRYILVDEWQDTNTVQYLLTKLLAESHRNLFVIGDMDQSIYRWRQADYRNIIHFERDFPEAKVILLEQNYRSTRRILESANNVIEKNLARKEKVLWTENEHGEKIRLFEAASERSEAEFVVEEILRLTTEGGVAPREITVLFRTNAQSRIIEETFLRYAVPYKIVGSVKFYERKEIKDVLAWLTVSVNKTDAVSRKRVIHLPSSVLNSRGGDKIRKQDAADALIDDFSKQTKEVSLAALIRYIIKKTDYEKHLRDGTESGEMRWENIQELVGVANAYDERGGEYPILRFLEEVKLLQEAGDVDETKENRDVVQVMTIHAAKGLEFHTVFLTGCEEGILPHSRSFYNAGDLEEERRLCYVAITRAKKKLFLTFAKRRTLFGSLEANPPSRFLLDFAEDNVTPERYDGENNEGVIELT